MCYNEIMLFEFDPTKNRCLRYKLRREGVCKMEKFDMGSIIN